MLRKSLAAFFGIALAFVLVGVIESLGHMIYAPPPELDYSNAQQLNDYIESLPIGALLFPLLAWIVASFGGGLLACYISREKPYLYASLVGGVILLATLLNFAMIKHPLWFAIVSVIALLTTIYLTGSLAYRFKGIGETKQG